MTTTVGIMVYGGSSASVVAATKTAANAASKTIALIVFAPCCSKR